MSTAQQAEEQQRGQQRGRAAVARRPHPVLPCRRGVRARGCVLSSFLPPPALAPRLQPRSSSGLTPPKPYLVLVQRERQGGALASSFFCRRGMMSPRRVDYTAR